MAEEAKKKFLEFDWKDARWQSYLSGLYPTPPQKSIIKFKKKWFQKTIDANLDLNWDPSAAPEPTQQQGQRPAGGAAPGAGYQYGQPQIPAMKPSEITTTFVLYLVAVCGCIANIFGLISPIYCMAIMVMCMGFECFAKYRIQFNTEWLRKVFLDEVGQNLFMVPSLYVMKNDAVTSFLSTVPILLSCVLALGQLSKQGPKVPGFILQRLQPLGEVQMRYQIMELRADMEVSLLVVLLLLPFFGRYEIISLVVYSQYLLFRYKLNAFTQQSMRKIDTRISPILSKIGPVFKGYNWIKAKLWAQINQ